MEGGSDRVDRVDLARDTGSVHAEGYKLAIGLDESLSVSVDTRERVARRNAT